MAFSAQDVEMEIPDEIRPSEQRSFHIPKHNLLPDMISEKASPDEKIEGEPLGDPAAVNPTEGHLLLPNRLHTKVVDYDDYALPANLRYAEIHGRVTMAGNLNAVFNLRDPFTSQKLPNYDKVKDLPTEDCPCCKKINVIGEKVSLLTKTIHLGSLGTAIPGFFEFAKFTVYIYSACLVTYSLYLMVTYGLAQFCIYGQATTDGGQVKADNSRYACGDSWKFFFTGANGAANLTDIWERLIWVGTVLILFVIKAFYYRKFRKIKSESEAITTDITDYSVELRGLPTDISMKDIVDFFAKQELKDDDGKVVPLRVQLVNFVYGDISKITKMDDKLKGIVENFLENTTSRALEIRKITEGGSFDEEKYIGSFDGKFDIKQDKYEKLLEESYLVPRTERAEVPNLIGEAFVSFETMEQAELVKKHMQIRGLGRAVNSFFGGLRGPFRSLRGAKNYRLSHKGDSGPYFCVEEAAAPGEILWEHRGYWTITRYFRKSISWLLNITFIAAIFGCVLVLKVIEAELDPKEGSTQAVSIFISVMIELSGLLCAYICEKLVKFSLPLTTSDKNIQLIWTDTTSMFLVSTLALVWSNQIAYQGGQFKKQVFLKTGLMNDLQNMVYLMSLEVLFAFLDKAHIIRIYKRCRMKSNHQREISIQKVMNEIYEGESFDYPVRFAKYLNLMMLTFFLVKAMPLAPAYAIALTAVFYWADKWYLLRWAKVPEVCPVQLCIDVLRLLDMAFLAWTIGYIILDDIEFGNFSDWSLAMFLVALFLVTINSNTVLENIFSNTSRSKSKQTKSLKFIDFLKTVRPDTYEVVNPVDAFKRTLAHFKQPDFLKQIRVRQNTQDKTQQRRTDLEKIMQGVVQEVYRIQQSQKESLGRKENEGSGVHQTHSP